MKLNIKAAFNTLLSGQTNFFSTLFFGGKIIDSGPYKRSEIPSAYTNGSETRLVIDKVVDNFVSIPTKWVDKDGKDLKTPPEQAKLLHSPNYIQTGSQFERDFILQWCLFDEVVIHGGTMGVALNRGKAEFLKVIQGQYVSFKLDEFGAITKIVNTYNQTTELDLEDVKITMGSVVDPAITQHATSKLITASKLLKKMEQGHDMDITSFGNKGANYLVSAGDEVGYDKTKADNAQEQLNNPSLKGGIRFMGAKVSVHDISKTPADLNILETSKDSRKVLALMYGLPIPLVSEDASAYGTVYEMAEKSFTLNTTIPLKQMYCEQISEFLDDGKGNKLIVDLKKVRQIQKDPKEVQETLVAANASVYAKWEAAGLDVSLLTDPLWKQPVTSIQDQFGITPEIDLV